MIDTAAPAATTRTPRSVALLRRPPILRLASSCAASMVAGLVVGGLGARLVMRLSAIAADDSRIGMITENGNVVGVITTEGTLALLLVGLVAGLSTGLILFVLRTVLPGRALPLWVSLVLLVVASPLAIDPANADFTIVGNRGSTWRCSLRSSRPSDSDRCGSRNGSTDGSCSGRSYGSRRSRS